jgi:hypothetical protein
VRGAPAAVDEVQAGALIALVEQDLLAVRECAARQACDGAGGQRVVVEHMK